LSAYRWKDHVRSPPLVAGCCSLSRCLCERRVDRIAGGTLHIGTARSQKNSLSSMGATCCASTSESDVEEKGRSTTGTTHRFRYKRWRPSPSTACVQGGRMTSSQQEWLSQVIHVLETLNQGVIINDSQRRVVFANSTFLEMIGLRSEELLGRVITDVFPPEDVPRLLGFIGKR